MKNKRKAKKILGLHKARRNITKNKFRRNCFKLERKAAGFKMTDRKKYAWILGDLMWFLGFILIGGSIFPYIYEMEKNAMNPIDNLGILLWCQSFGWFLVYLSDKGMKGQEK